MPHSSFARHGQLILLLIAGFVGSLGCEPNISRNTQTSNPPNESSTPWEDPASIAFEPLPHHPRLELFNLQFGRGLGGSETFAVDWRVASGEVFPGTRLVVKQSNRPMMEMAVQMWPGETEGTIDASVESFGDSTSLQSGCEIYLVAVEGDVRHKISNSVTAGSASSTSTRQATAEELAKFEDQTPEGAVDLPADVIVPDGTKLWSMSNQKFERVTVINSLADGGLRIRYDNHDFEGDYPRASLKIDSELLATLSRQPSPMGNSETASTPADANRPTPSTPGGSGAEERLVEVPGNVPLSPGTPLRALYGSQWRPVTVVMEQADGKVKIHWEGYSDSWDEAKSRVDLRIETAILEKIRRGDKVGGSPAMSQEPSNANFDPQKLSPGDKLQAEWAGKWLPVTVKAVRPDGRVEIHWDGYSDNFDEPLPVDRLRKAN